MIKKTTYVSVKLDCEFEDFDTAIKEEAKYDLSKLILNFLGDISTVRVRAPELLVAIVESQEILAGLLSREMLTEELERRIQEKV